MLSICVTPKQYGYIFSHVIHRIGFRGTTSSVGGNMKKVVAFGNPLLDTTIFLNDTYLLTKYNLNPDDQKEIPENLMKRLSDDISGYQQFNSAGGCAQNSLRILQWLTGSGCQAFIFGSVGKDKEAAILRELLETDKVQTRYTVQENLPTGKSIALILGPCRSLVAYLGAAEKLPLSDLLLQKDFTQLVLDSDFVYIEGFFLTNRIETARYVMELCNKHNKVLLFNISGKYVCNLYPEEITYFVENCDIVFGNKREFEAVAKIMNITMDELIIHLLRKTNSKLDEYGKVIVVTNGANPGFCFYQDKTESFDALKIKNSDIKDTTGAGDAFVGGFIAGLCANKSIADCAKIGSYAAFHIIQQIGCTLPTFHPDIK